MQKIRPLLRWTGTLLVSAAILCICIEARGETGPAKAPGEKRPDLIKIDTLAAYQKLELPPVTFFHDKHTDALLKEKKDCETCHFVENKQLVLTFKPQKGITPAEFKDAYHEGCIGCHMEMAAAGKKTGPPDGLCRSCHNAEPKITSAKLGAGMEKVLHYRHVDAKTIAAAAGEKDNCSRCHHEYDKQAKKTVYAKGQEQTCRNCHGDKAQNGVKSLGQAAHQQCVLCHLDLDRKNVKDNGPVVCAGCHGAAGQAKIAKKNQEAVAKLQGKEIPRLLRGQPDAALITSNPKFEEGKATKPLVMNPVAFDHKAHEKYNNNCQVCHHASMDSCQKCHTLSGTKEGQFVTFEQAMHLSPSKRSCQGCHAAEQAKPECAGCHSSMAKKKPDDASCNLCHQPLPGEVASQVRKDVVLTPQQQSGIAATLLKGRNMNPGTFPESDIPDKVVLKDLSDKYKPAELSHRKHVLALMKGMKDNPLAKYFHRDQGTMCQGCHHNSPAAKNPPGCGNCHAQPHGKALSANEPARPGLLAALHGQCMSCHKDMAVKPEATACTACHQEKKK